MTGNKIGDKGAMCFAQALQINMTLEDLDLADCDLVSQITCMVAFHMVNHRILIYSVNKNYDISNLVVAIRCIFLHIYYRLILHV